MAKPRTKKLLVRVPHEELNIERLLTHLSEDVIYVFFRKKTNGQFRSIYPFTRNPKYMPYDVGVQATILTVTEYLSDIMEDYMKQKSFSVSQDRGFLVKAWSVLDNGWRSFYTNNLLFYEVYDFEGDTLE